MCSRPALQHVSMLFPLISLCLVHPARVSTCVSNLALSPLLQHKITLTLSCTLVIELCRVAGQARINPESSSSTAVAYGGVSFFSEWTGLCSICIIYMYSEYGSHAWHRMTHSVYHKNLWKSWLSETESWVFPNIQCHYLIQNCCVFIWK